MPEPAASKRSSSRAVAARSVTAVGGRSGRGSAARTRGSGVSRGRAGAPPVLVRQIRSGIVESEHRGHVVEVDAVGRVLHLVGDPDHIVTLRSTIKPFGLVALVEAGGIEAWDISPAELAIMASSHSGEDLHVRTIQGLYRRAGVSQSALACGAEGMPLDELTAARLARDGERPSPIRHMCSGQHSVFLLLCKMNGWSPDGYWAPDHPAQVAYRSAVARAYGIDAAGLATAIDGCGLPTYAVALRDVARAYALLADPAAIPSSDPRSSVAPALLRIRDAMRTHPEMVAGNRDRLDTSLMKAVDGQVVSKGGMEALRGLAILPGARPTGRAGATGMALKIEDGDGYERATWAVTVEALAQVGVLDGRPLRALGRYHRPPALDPHGRVAAEAIPEFDLAPVGELVG